MSVAGNGLFAPIGRAFVCDDATSTVVLAFAPAAGDRVISSPRVWHHARGLLPPVVSVAFLWCSASRRGASVVDTHLRH